jgi:hypothetical protein
MPIISQRQRVTRVSTVYTVTLQEMHRAGPMILVATVDELTPNGLLHKGNAWSIFYFSFMEHAWSITLCRCVWLIEGGEEAQLEGAVTRNDNMGRAACRRRTCPGKRKRNIKTVHAVRLIFVACSCDVLARTSSILIWSFSARSNGRIVEYNCLVGSTLQTSLSLTILTSVSQW